MEESNENYSQTAMNFNEVPDADLVKKYERKDIGPEASKLLYYVLTDAAMEYRDRFIDDDIIALTSNLNKSDDYKKVRVGRDAANMSIKNIRIKFAEIINKEKSRLRQLSKMNKNEVENFISGMPEMGNRIKFKTSVEFMKECSEQIILASDAQEVLMLLKMYNSGDLDILFTEYRKEKGGKDEAAAASVEQENIPG